MPLSDASPLQVQAGVLPSGRPHGGLYAAVITVLALSSSTAAQPNDKTHARTIPIGGVGQEPRYTLDVSASGRTGTIVVRDALGAKGQTLTCDLFRDWESEIATDADTTARVLDYHAGIFVSGLKIADLDFDRLPDIMAARDGGAKWTTYCVWLFDPNQDKFVQNPLSHQMEELMNLTADTVRRRILSFTIGPTDPTRDE